ncbi:MAG: heme-binding protein [Chloroflexi bacterium]|nr:MAG: heme-binding protein [Chloroflexota bacterium]
MRGPAAGNRAHRAGPVTAAFRPPARITGSDLDPAPTGRNQRHAALARTDAGTADRGRGGHKTQTVILTGKATLEFGRHLREDLGEEPELFHGMIARRDLVPFGGGVPLLIAGRLAGAVAVSGATSIQDHEIAQRAASLLGG